MGKVFYYVWLPVISLEILALVPLLFYYAREYQRKMRHPLIHPRFPKLVLFVQWVGIFFLSMCTLPSAISTLVSRTTDTYAYDFGKGSRHGWDFSLLVIFALCTYPARAAALTRIWLAFFRIQHSVACREKRWMTHITSQSTCALDEIDWFIAHRTTLGSSRYLAPRTIAASFIVVGTQCATTWLNPVYGRFHLFFWNLLWMLCIWAIRCRIPWFEDRIFLREEVDLVVKTASATIAVWGIYSFLAPRSLPAALVILIFGVASYAGVLLVQTWMILRRVREFERSGGTLSAARSLPSVSKSTSSRRRSSKLTSAPISDLTPLPSIGSGGNMLPSSLSSTTASAAHSRPLSLEDVLADEIGFSTFMDHLFREMSSENLLAVVEIQMFQALHLPQLTRLVDLPPNVEQLQSAILLGAPGNPPLQARLLMEKYLLETAPLCVNISWEVQVEVERAYGRLRPDGEDKQVLFLGECFQRVIEEILDLLYDSLRRFRSHEDYGTLKNLLEQQRLMQGADQTTSSLRPPA